MPDKSILPDDKTERLSPNVKLRDQRTVLHLTQRQVADRAGIKLQQYQKFESGERNIMTASFQIACRVLEALELDIIAFFHGGYTTGER